MLLHDVGAPAGDAGRDEDRRVLRHGNAHRVVRHAAGEIDVGEDAFFFVHDGLDFFADLEPLERVAALFVGIRPTQAVQDRCAMVAAFVDAVAEAHDLFLGGECVCHVWLDVVECADFFEHFHCLFVGPAVQRTFEGSDSAGDGAVHIAEGAGDDSAGERARVEIVLSIKNERNIDDVRLLSGRLGASHHVKKVGSVIERWIGRDNGSAVNRILHVPDDGRDLRGQADRLAKLRLG